MQLFLCNNRPVVRLGGRNFIVDTGSPVSFHYGGRMALEIGGQGFLLCSRGICDKEMADALTGTDIAGFIGMEILQKTGLTIDLERGTLDFACVPNPDSSAIYAELAIDLYEGLYVVTDDLYLGRRLHQVIVDTGARIPCITDRLAGRLEETGEPYEDDSPQFGPLWGDLLRGSLVFGATDRDVVRSVKWGLMPEILDLSGLFDGIVGISALTDKRLVFDFKRKVLRVKV